MGVPGVCRRGVTDCTGVALSGDYLTLSNNERTLRYRLSMGVVLARTASSQRVAARSEEHTSELQSQSNLVCRLLLEKKKTHNPHGTQHPVLVVSTVARAAVART